ncbi:MAG TPA: hypothetical protein PK031_04285, partial [Pseudomonadales bacterium]|nr:hypothetical protein [Pseudomonadales bacterium]
GILESGVQIIIFDINTYGRNDKLFITAIDQQIQESTEIHHLSTLDISNLLDESSYFPLDGHINPQGHEIIARQLAAKIHQCYP